MARVRELGVEDHVVFLDQFVDQATLLEFISMCDVYVTPYLNEAQMTSGTLAYSFGLGQAGRFDALLACAGIAGRRPWRPGSLRRCGGDRQAKSRNCSPTTPRRQAMRERAYAVSRSMTWERTAERYMAAFENARQGHWLKVIARTGPVRDRATALRRRTCKSAIFCRCATIPACSSTPCIRCPIARTAIASTTMPARCCWPAPSTIPANSACPEVLTARFAAFVQHAWNPDTRRFRNFMGFDRTWLEDRGSEDSHGRTLWALGECARRDASPSRRRWAAALFAEALPAVEAFRSPRAWAFTLLGLDAYCAVVPDDRQRPGNPAFSCRQVDVRPRVGRDAGLGRGSRKGWPMTTRACRRP